jgi:ABC-type Mn2+/Zn2+ transport system ATPase subunit
VEPDESLKSVLTSSESFIEKMNSPNPSKYLKILHDVNMSFPSNQITMVIGNTGSGKSSLLYAILNEMTP